MVDKFNVKKQEVEDMLWFFDNYQEAQHVMVAGNKKQWSDDFPEEWYPNNKFNLR